MSEGVHKETVHGEVVPPSEDAQALKATRLSNAEQLAVERHDSINRVWEFTQATMALLIVACVLATSIFIVVTKDISQSAFVALNGFGNLVIGFYFGRTNHTRPTGENR